MKLPHLILLAAMVMFAVFEVAAQPAASNSPTINESYAGLASGVLSFATLGELPDGMLLRSDSLEITAGDLDADIAQAPEAVRESLKKNGFFALEQMAIKSLLLAMAKKQAADASAASTPAAEQELLDTYFKGLVAQVQVTDEEVAKFYEENKDACGGATLEQVKGQLKQYVMQQKQQEAVQEHVRTLGQRMPIVVAASWAKDQAVLAKDNPVDKARASGMPSIVDFGATGCKPCDMMAPILSDMKKKFEGKANVLFIHVREEQILAGRYGVQTIPVQVFFDKEGKEVYRHTGFFPQAEMEKKLAELGVQ